MLRCPNARAKRPPPDQALRAVRMQQFATHIARCSTLSSCMANLASPQLWRRNRSRSPAVPRRLIWVKQRHLSRRRLLAKFRRSTELYSGAVEKLLVVLLISLVSIVSHFATNYCISILLNLSSTVFERQVESLLRASHIGSVMAPNNGALPQLSRVSSTLCTL